MLALSGGRQTETVAVPELSPAQILHSVQDDKEEALTSPPIERPGARGARGVGV